MRQGLIFTFALFLTFEIQWSTASASSSVFGTTVIGNPCVIDDSCVGQPDRSECFEDTCRCRDGFTPKLDRLDCLPIRNELGEACEESPQCSLGLPGKYSECSAFDGCQCSNEGVSEPGAHLCHKKAAKLGDPCEVQVQCEARLGNLSECEKQPPGGPDGWCGCKLGSVGSVTLRKCLPSKILIGGECEESAQCVGSPGLSSYCTILKCACLPNYISSRRLDDCLPIVNFLGDPCTESQQCSGGRLGEFSECGEVDDRMVCKCTSDAVSPPGEHVCLKKSGLVGGPCEISGQCIPNKSHCAANYTCQCDTNFVASSDLTRCLAKGVLGDYCEDDTQCGGVDHAVCLLGQCQCDPDHVQHPGSDDRCNKLATRLGDSCSANGNQCDRITESVCQEPGLTCECDLRTHVPSQNRDKCLRRSGGLNETCTEDAQCNVEHSECVIGVGESVGKCGCKVGEYVESKLRPGTCIELMGEPHLPCQEDSQCFTPDGDLECRAGFCLCRLGYADYEGACYRPVPLHQLCQSHEECYLGVNSYAICRFASDSMTRCRCGQNIVEYEGSCYLSTRVGGACESDEDCQASISGQVYCSRDRCSCMPGQEADREGKQCSGGFVGKEVSQFLTMVMMLIAVLQKLE